MLPYSQKMRKRYKKAKFNLTKALKKREISQYQLRKALDLDSGELSKIKARKNPTLNTLNKLAAGIEKVSGKICKVSDLLDE